MLDRYRIRAFLESLEEDDAHVPEIRPVPSYSPLNSEVDSNIAINIREHRSISRANLSHRSNDLYFIRSILSLNIRLDVSFLGCLRNNTSRSVKKIYSAARFFLSQIRSW